MVKWMSMTDDDILSILTQSGPLTGAHLLERTRMEVLALWRTCRKAFSVQFKTAGRRFLRLDRNVQGYARLSPSIRREFLTFTYVGLDSQIEELAAKADALESEIRSISRAKLDIAKNSIVSALSHLQHRDVLLDKACFIIGGDVVYDMSHKVPRPEKSTGEMVRGSDLDIIIVAEDDTDPETIDSLDKAIHKRKHLLLVNDREEIDYLIKSLSRVREQIKFDIFSSMVACKILNEGRLLYGSPRVFETVKNLLSESKIPERLKSLEEQAIAERTAAEAQLQEGSAQRDQNEAYNLFYTRAEEDEIY
jgi:hypothetical protein